MKKCLVLSMAVVCFLAFFTKPAYAQIKLGIHGGVSTGGGLEKSDVVIGGQIAAPLTEDFSIELSVTKFEDGNSVLMVDITHIAATFRFSTPLMDQKAKLYGGFGFSYNQFDATVVSLPGYFVDIDDSMGFHGAAGVKALLTKNTELFGEYRHVWTKSTAEVRGPCATDIVKGDYNFGLFRVGINLIF